MTRPWYDRRMGEFPMFVQVIVATVLLTVTVAAFVVFVLGITDLLTENSETHCGTTALDDNR